jgi:hypothetical protein
MSRQYLMGFLAFLMVSLAACATSTPLPAGTGQLLSERSQVFFQKTGQSAEEVALNGIRAAGAGDEAWTQSRGRALLRFSDLWARLYDDTAFHVTDVTPSSTKATLGAGAVLIGESSQSPQRVEIVVGTPPRARVVLSGTLIMIAYIPSERVALVRTFDGKADISVLASGQSVRSGSDGTEWVLIGPDDRIETPSRDDVRALVRDVGFWDQYHEIEVDATGFGPPAARIPAERVTMTFVETPAIAPTSTVRPPATSTPAPTKPECRVVASRLIIRQGPGTNYPTLGASLSSGTRLLPLGRNSDSTWALVQVIDSGREGWVSASGEYIVCNQPVNGLPVVGAPPVPAPTSKPPIPTPIPTRTPLPVTVTSAPCTSQFGFSNDVMRQLGCPTDRVADRATVYQRFQNGMMVIFAGPGDSWGGGAILALSNDGRAWRVTDSFVQTSQNPDEWYTCEQRPGQRPEQSGIPWRGFGKVWCENPEIRGALGYATSSEESARGAFEVYKGGRAFQIDADRVYVVEVPNDGWMAAGHWR